MQRTSGGGTFEAQQIPTSNTTVPQGGGGTFEAQQIPTSNTTVPQGGGGTFEAQQAPVTPGGPAAPKIAGGFNTQPPPTGATPPQQMKEHRLPL